MKVKYVRTNRSARSMELVIDGWGDDFLDTMRADVHAFETRQLKTIKTLTREMLFYLHPYFNILTMSTN